MKVPYAPCVLPLWAYFLLFRVRDLLFLTIGRQVLCRRRFLRSTRQSTLLLTGEEWRLLPLYYGGVRRARGGVNFPFRRRARRLLTRL